MKTVKTFLFFCFLLTEFISAQHITNTLGENGTFTIKDGTPTTFLNLDQADGYLNLTKSLKLPETSGSTVGVIYKGSDRFIHNFAPTGANGLNTFVGINSGNFVAMSASASYEASNNTAVGHSTLKNLTSGFDNSAFGTSALTSNTTGFYNSAFGTSALTSNTTGFYNSAFGDNAGDGVTTGSNNTSIGYDAQVPYGTSSNQVRIGNTSVTYYGVSVSWTTNSDRRLKRNILPTNLGIGFISKLNPVSYIRKNDKKERTEYGLIAQEVEEVLKQEGIENSGMITVTDKGNYELRYNDLIAPMIKAIQDLKFENDALAEENTKLQIELEILRSSIAGIVKAEVKAAFLREVENNGSAAEVKLLGSTD